MPMSFRLTMPYLYLAQSISIYFYLSIHGTSQWHLVAPDVRTYFVFNQNNGGPLQNCALKD